MTLLSTPLPARGFIAVGGEEAAAFLQGLVTNNIDRLSPTRALYSALLSPQGKFLHDFILFLQGGSIWIDCEKQRREDLLKRLTMYRLRAKVTLAPAEQMHACAVTGEGAAAAFGLPQEAGAAQEMPGSLVACVDPRHAGLGVRLYGLRAAVEKELAAKAVQPATAFDYETLRLSLAIPDGSRDILPERSLAIEHGLEDLHGVDFGKGCYVGQEVMARAKHRGVLRKFIYQVTSDRNLPPAGTAVTLDGKEAGELRSSLNGRGLALLRHEFVDQAQGGPSPLVAAGIALTAGLPPWARVQFAEPA